MSPLQSTSGFNVHVTASQQGLEHSCKTHTQWERGQDFFYRQDAYNFSIRWQRNFTFSTKLHHYIGSRGNDQGSLIIENNVKCNENYL